MSARAIVLWTAFLITVAAAVMLALGPLGDSLLESLR